MKLRLRRLRITDDSAAPRWPLLIVIYFLQNLPHLALGDAKFWDDWYTYSDLTSLRALERNCPIDRCGKIPLTYLWEQPLLEIGNWALRFVVFIAFLISAYLFWRILADVGVSRFQSAAASMLFLLIPANGARVSLVTARASLMLLLFTIGVFLVLGKGALRKCIGYLMLAFAMFQPSFLVFVFIVPLVLLTKELCRTGRIRCESVSAFAILVLMAGMHRVVIPDLLVSAQVVGSDTGAYNTIRSPFLIRALVFCGSLTIPLLVEISRQFLRCRDLSRIRLPLFLVGMFVLGLGTFPYMAVGHFSNFSDWVVVFLPDESDWNSRHQLLQGFGYAILFAGLLDVVVEKWRPAVLSLVLCACTTVGFSMYSNYYVDFLKQQDVSQELVSLSSELESVSIFAVVDEAQDLNARGRGVRSYEWQFLVEEALDRRISFYEYELPAESCKITEVGRTLVIRKVSGRLRALLTRKTVVDVEVGPLFACPK